MRGCIATMTTSRLRIGPFAYAMLLFLLNQSCFANVMFKLAKNGRFWHMYTTNAVIESSGYKSFHYGIISRIKKLGEILVASSLH